MAWVRVLSVGMGWMYFAHGMNVNFEGQKSDFTGFNRLPLPPCKFTVHRNFQMCTYLEVGSMKT